MRIKFIKKHTYAHDGRRLVEYKEGEIIDVDSDTKTHDAGFAAHVIKYGFAEEVAEPEAERKPENKALGGAGKK